MFDSIAKTLLVPERFYSLFDVLVIAVFIVFILLKIISLRRSWINGQKVWFIALILINTLGILEIVYLSTNKENPKPKEEKKLEENADKREAKAEIQELEASVSDIDNEDLVKEEVVESLNGVAREDIQSPEN